MVIGINKWFIRRAPPASRPAAGVVAKRFIVMDIAHQNQITTPNDETETPSVSVVIPVHNEAGNIGPFLREVEGAFAKIACEILVMDDASQDNSVEEVRGEMRGKPAMRLLRLGRRGGKSAAILAGARCARAPWIATLDGDGQNDPRDSAHIVMQLVDGRIEADLVSGRRRRRHDGLLKKVSSRLANSLRRRLFHDPTTDMACGVKVLRREMLLALPAFRSMHRFYAPLVIRAGGTVVEVEVDDRPRKHGQSKYGTIDRLLETIPDMLGVLWLFQRPCGAEIKSEECSPGNENEE